MPNINSPQPSNLPEYSKKNKGPKIITPEIHEITAPKLKSVAGEKKVGKPVNLLPESYRDIKVVGAKEGEAEKNVSFLSWKGWSELGTGYDAVSEWTEEKFSRVGDLVVEMTEGAQDGWDKIVFESKEVIQLVQDKAGEYADDLVELKDDAIDGVKRLFSHISQFSQGTAKEKQANCGPSSAHIVGTNMGLNMPSLASIRRSVGARTGNGRGPFAISTTQLMRAVTKQGAKEGRNITATQENLGTNVDRTLEKMKKALAEGKQVVLLSSNIKSGGKGHYVAINKVNDDGSIEISDPQSSNGANRVHTKAELKNALRRRVNKFGRQNTLMVFGENK